MTTFEVHLIDKHTGAVERAKRYPDPLTPFAPDPYWVYRPRTTKEKK